MGMTEPRWYRIVVFDESLDAEVIVMVKATNIHHAFNVIYEFGLIPKREATQEDYDTIYGQRRCLNNNEL